jgi:exo beta-1,2-glucooligosaccharide sophorohydrolase (non-reducing end)
MDFRNREINFRGDAVYFWCYSDEGIAAADLPSIRLQDTGRNFSRPQPLGKFVEGIPEKKWVQIRISLQEFTTGSIHQFESNRTGKIIFGQGTADSKEHTRIIDEIKIDDSTAAAAADAQNLPAPKNVSAKGYERHIDIAWDAVPSPDLQRYLIYR